MATQGLVTVIKGGKVVAKVVVGCNGFNAVILAQAIVQHGKFDHLFLSKSAEANGFGCPDCRIIAGVLPDKPEHVSVYGGVYAGVYGGDNDPQTALVRQTFHLRNFNPRWSRGTCDRVWIADLDKGKDYRIASYSGHPKDTH